MTKIVLSILFAMIILVATFSQSVIPCTQDDKWTLCKLEGEHTYFGTDILSSPWITGGIVYATSFFSFLVVLSSLQSVVSSNNRRGY